MLDILREERDKHNMQRILRMRVVNGALSGAVSDALAFGWECMTQEGDLKGVELVIVDAPLMVNCGGCGKPFTPEDKHYMPCPECGEILGHDIVSGKELYIDEIEADIPDEAPSEANDDTNASNPVDSGAPSKGE